MKWIWSGATWEPPWLFFVAIVPWCWALTHITCQLINTTDSIAYNFIYWLMETPSTSLLSLKIKQLRSKWPKRFARELTNSHRKPLLARLSIRQSHGGTCTSLAHNPRLAARASSSSAYRLLSLAYWRYTQA